MKNPLVSVVIPTYNRGRLIKKSVQSVLAQSYENVEVIVVDDGSTDNTEKIIKEIHDDRLKYFKLLKNQGACHARNFGIKKAKGDFIAMNDSDDIYSEEKIEKQVTNIIKHGSDIDICRVQFFVNQYTIIYPKDDELKSIKKKGLLNQVLINKCISNQARLIKRKILEKICYDEKMPRLQDYDLWLRLVPECKKISYTNEVLVYAYYSEDSISRNQNKLLDAVRIMLVKKYDIGLEGRKNLNNYLLSLIDNSYLEIKNKEIQKLSDDNVRLAKNNERLTKELTDIINSKTWRVAEKMRRMLKR